MFLNPLDRADDVPRNIPFEIAGLARIADSSGHELDVLDLNAYREANTKEGIKDMVKETDYELAWMNASFTAFGEAKRVINLVREIMPDAVTVLGGKVATYAPGEALVQTKGLDVAVVGDQEDVLPEIIDRVPGQRWSQVNGIAYREGDAIRHNPLRVPRTELDGVPFPKYRFVPLERYFQFSPMPLCPEALVSRRRLSFSWQRQHVDETGKAVVRLPSPKRAVENIVAARLIYAIDFALLIDASLMTNATWFSEFLDAYMNEGLHEVVAWASWADPVQLAKHPELVRSMKDAGCRAVQMEVMQAYRPTERQAALDVVRRVGIGVALRYFVGAPRETIEDLLEEVYFSFINKLDPYEVLPPNLYPDGPYFKDHKGTILKHYGNSLSVFLEDDSRNSPVSWPGGFDFIDVIALRSLVRSRDMENLLRYAHRRGYGHSAKWNEFCPVEKSRTVLQMERFHGG